MARETLLTTCVRVHCQFTKFCREKLEDVYCNFIIDVCNYRVSLAMPQAFEAGVLFSTCMAGVSRLFESQL